jgi:hypothetical protein
MYYLLGGRSWSSNPARLLDAVDDHDLWWDDGVPFDVPPSAPVTGVLEPYDSRNPDMSPELPEMYDVPILIFRDDLIAALQAAGVDNMHLYGAEITDPDSGQVYTNYKAVNIIGLVAAADMDKSEAIVHDGIPLVDVNFNKLVLDPDKTQGLLFFRLAENNGAVMVHQSVRDHLLASGFGKVEFYDLDQAAI